MEAQSLIRMYLCSTRYLLVPGFLDSNETDTLLARAKQLLDEFRLDDHPLVRMITCYAVMKLAQC